MAADVAWRILQFADSRETRVQQKAVSVAAKTREDTASVTMEHKLLSVNQESLYSMLKNLDETERL